MEARIGEERGRGIPLTDIQRVARHYGISLEEAKYWLTVHPIEILLPQKGYGLTQAIEPPPNGPGPLGHLAAIAIGAYTEIVDIIAPVEAAYGDLVSVEVRVRNLYSSPIYIATTGHYDGIDFALAPEYATVEAGATYSFTYSFVMPSNDVRLEVWSFYWVEEISDWYQDDYSYVDIAP
ncbi:hypothetical protein ES703_71654 [subsurface metagenome]